MEGVGIDIVAPTNPEPSAPAGDSDAGAVGSDDRSTAVEGCAPAHATMEWRDKPLRGKLLSLHRMTPGRPRPPVKEVKESLAFFDKVGMVQHGGRTPVSPG